jgi:hypothetical protein
MTCIVLLRKKIAGGSAHKAIVLYIYEAASVNLKRMIGNDSALSIFLSPDN